MDGKKRWWRDTTKAVLLSTAMFSVLGACWVGARYHKHARAAFIAWRWATDGGEPRWCLGYELKEMKASNDVGVLAAKIAYRLANDEPRRTAAAVTAARYGGLQAVYNLARGDARRPQDPGEVVYTFNGLDDIGDMRMTRAEGGSSPAERVLALCFHDLGICPQAVSWLKSEGACDFWWTDSLSEITGEMAVGEEFVEQKRGSFSFGSYRITEYSHWRYQISEEGESSWLPMSISASHVVMERLPGPWRELPPAPPDSASPEQDASRL